MPIHGERPFDPVGGQETPEQEVGQTPRPRRRFLKLAAAATGTAGLLGGGGYLGWRWWRGSDKEVVAAGVQPRQVEQRESEFYEAPLDARFEYGRNESFESDIARYTNFYEFSSSKSSWTKVGPFVTDPWRVTVGGLCRHQLEFDIDDLERRFLKEHTERQYRHRCVETWAMAVPWIGIPLRHIIKAADPLPTATHVRFISFNRPKQAPHMRSDRFPWPYAEGLTLPEAANDLTLLATGMYGHPLLKQNGAPVRLIVPWKYGFKSIKSIERIEFVDHEPATFWTTLRPQAYPFESNVDPDVHVPWNQSYEKMLGSNRMHETVKYNGYGQWVAKLYEKA